LLLFYNMTDAVKITGAWKQIYKLIVYWFIN
jgi:hypothetical protein